MKATINTEYQEAEVIQVKELKSTNHTEVDKTKAFDELEQGVNAALETYSNVHRGSGHFSMVSTHLYEQAREIVLEYLGLEKSKFVVIFCTPLRAALLMKQVEPTDYQIMSSKEIGLSLGVKALAVKKTALPKGAPFQTGGGTARLISKTWIVWAKAPDRFEAGTPAIINVIAFAKALLLLKKYGKDIFLNPVTKRFTAKEILYNDELEKYSGLELLHQLKQTLVGKGVGVPTMEGIRPFINLDNSASTPTFTPVWNAFRQALHQNEQIKQEIISEVKSICAGFLGAPLSNYDLFFTSNTTEAINLAAESLSRTAKDGSEPVVLNTILEHSSNDLPWRMITDGSLIHLMVDTEGFVDLKEMEKMLIHYNQNVQYGKKRIRLVAISGASNVLGVCNNIQEISHLVHQYGANLLVDAAQLVAHRKIDMEACGIDYLAFSAHKVYAPFGCGVLLARKGLLKFNSSELEVIHSSGEENIGGIAALGKSFLLLQRIGMEIIEEEEQALTKRAISGMAQINGIKIYGINNLESPGFKSKVGVIVFGIKGMMANKVANELALQSGIGVRYGCHCAHIIVKHILNIPPFLEKFQRLIVTLFPKLRLPGLTRVSLGIENSEEDVDKLIHTLGKITRNTQTNKNKAQTSINKNGEVVSHKDIQKHMAKFVRDASYRVYNQYLIK